MPNLFRVLDLSGLASVQAEETVTAPSPEAAAALVLGVELVRSGAKKDLVAKVYWNGPESALNMVRLYRKVEGSRRR